MSTNPVAVRTTPPTTPRGGNPLLPDTPVSPAPSPNRGIRNQLSIVLSSEGVDSLPQAGSTFPSDDSREKVKKTTEIGFYCMVMAAVTLVGIFGQFCFYRKRIWVYPLVFAEGVFASALGVYGLVRNEIAKLEAQATSQKKIDIGTNLVAEINQPVGILEYLNCLPCLISFFQCLMNMPRMEENINQYIVTAKGFINIFEKYYAGAVEANKLDAEILTSIFIVLTGDDLLIAKIQNIPEFKILAKSLQDFKNALENGVPLPKYETAQIESLYFPLFLLNSKKYKYLLEKLKNELSLEKKGFETLSSAIKKYKELQEIQDGTKKNSRDQLVEQDKKGKKQTLQTELTWRNKLPFFYNPLLDFNKFLREISVPDDPSELVNRLTNRNYGPKTQDLFFERVTGSVINGSQPKKEWSSYLSINVDDLVSHKDDKALERAIQSQIRTAPDCLILKLDRYSAKDTNHNSFVMPDTFELNGSEYRKKCFIVRESAVKRDSKDPDFYYSAYVERGSRWWNCSDNNIYSVSNHYVNGYLYFYERQIN